MRKIEGMVAVGQHPYSFAGIWIFHLLNRNRGLAVSHLIGARFIGKISKDNTIQTHIRNRIGHILSERSAVAVFDISIETAPLRITTSGLKGLVDELA